MKTKSTTTLLLCLTLLSLYKSEYKNFRVERKLKVTILSAHIDSFPVGPPGLNLPLELFDSNDKSLLGKPFELSVSGSGSANVKKFSTSELYEHLSGSLPSGWNFRTPGYPKAPPNSGDDDSEVSDYNEDVKLVLDDSVSGDDPSRTAGSARPSTSWKSWRSRPTSSRPTSTATSPGTWAPCCWTTPINSSTKGP